jgi:hypothetical protein
MARNFGVTVKDERYEEFVRQMIKLGNVELRVGILRAGVKYPAGWVGTKSRINDTMGRFSALKSGERQRTMLAAYRKKKSPAATYGRRAKRKRVDVAKVAAVVGFEAGKRPKLPSMWVVSVGRNDQFVHSRASMAMKNVLGGASGVRAITQIGARLSMAYKADVLRSTHRDTGLLLKTIDWEIVDNPAKDAAREVAAAKRAARKAKAKARAGR